MKRISKELIVMEDLATSKDVVSQTRMGNGYSLRGTDIRYPVNSTAELQALDPARFSTARLYISNSEFTELYYDADSDEGISSSYGGSWLNLVNSDYAASGSYGNPYMHTTTYDFVNAIPFATGTYKVNDWIRCEGRTQQNDQYGALYQVTTTPPTGLYNYENYIPLDGDGKETGVTVWAVLKEGYKQDFSALPIEIIAHRGFNNVAIQNTLLGMSLAMQYNADALEMDVQVTSDGILVCYHDLTLDQDTDGTGPISSYTYANLQALTFDELVGTLNATKVRITKFEEILKYAKRCGTRIYPEIKAYRSLADVEIMVNMIEAYEYESMTIFQSFNFEDLEEVRRLNKRIGVGWLTVSINTTQEYDYFFRLQKLKYADVLIRSDRVILYPAIIDFIHEAGVGVATWTPYDNTEVEKILAAGVTRIMSDVPYDKGLTRGLNNVNY